MHTTQIMILSILGVIFLILSFKLIISCSKNMNQFKGEKANLTIVGLIFIFLITISLLIDSSIQLNQKSKQLKNKCPEYEKVENIYKLKKQ